MNEPALTIEALLELCERERVAVAAGDIGALGAAALARTELSRRLGRQGDIPPELIQLLRRLKAAVSRNLGLYEELIRVTAAYSRWVERRRAGGVPYGPRPGGAA